MVRILVVDNCHDSADSLAAIFRLAGHEVRTAYDGPTAVEVARGFRPDVVFLDLGMPHMDGYAVARRLRQEFPAGGLRLAAFSGFADERHHRLSREVGFDEHFDKGSPPECLLHFLDGHECGRT